MKFQNSTTLREITMDRLARPAIFMAAAIATIGLTVSIAVADQTAYVGNYSHNSISVIDLDEGVTTHTIATSNPPREMTLSNDGSTLYAVLAGAVVLAVDTATNVATPLTTSEGPSAFGIAISADDSKLYVANSNFWAVSVIDAQTGDLLTSIPVVANPVYTAMSPTEDRLYVSTANIFANDGKITVIDTTTDTVDHVIEGPHYQAEIAVTPDGSLLFASHEFDAAVSVFDTATNSLVTTIAVAEGPRGITFSADGQTAYVANAYASMVTAIDVSSLAVTGSMSVGGFPYMVGVGHDGRTFVTQGSANAVAEFDLASETVIGSIPVGTAPYAIVVASPSAPGCAEDLTGDGLVDGADLAALLAQWGPCDSCNDCPADLNDDCIVDGADLAALLASWGPCD